MDLRTGAPPKGGGLATNVPCGNPPPRPSLAVARQYRQEAACLTQGVRGVHTIIGGEGLRPGPYCVVSVPPGVEMY